MNTTSPRLCKCMKSSVKACPVLTQFFYRRVVPILEKVFLKTLHKMFQVKIPPAEKPIVPRIKAIWDKYMDELVGLIRDTAPQLLPHVVESIPVMSGVQDEIADKVHEALTKLSKCSAEIHPEFRVTMEEKLVPMFEECLEIKGMQKSSSFDVPGRKLS